MVEAERHKVTVMLQDTEPNSALSDQLLPLIYEQLRQLAVAQMAQESPGDTLQPTALVHEAYLRLVEDVDVRWESRGHFYSAAARCMRQILINRAHRRKAVKHGAGRRRQELSIGLLATEPPSDHMLALDEALNRLEEVDPGKAKIVLLRYFAGLSIEDTAKSLSISPATVKRNWQFARAWLHREMNE